MGCEQAFPGSIIHTDVYLPANATATLHFITTSFLSPQSAILWIFDMVLHFEATMLIDTQQFMAYLHYKHFIYELMPFQDDAHYFDGRRARFFYRHNTYYVIITRL